MTEAAQTERWLQHRRELRARLLQLTSSQDLQPVHPHFWNRSIRPGEPPTPQALRDTEDWNAGRLAAPPERVVRFPSDRVLGTLYVRDWADDDAYTDRLCLARGVVAISAGKYLTLSCTREAPADLSPLDALGSNDLQELYLWGELVTDALLPGLQRLSGLRELDLSNGTSVTAEGVAALQAALPACRIIAPW